MTGKFAAVFGWCRSRALLAVAAGASLLLAGAALSAAQAADALKLLTTIPINGNAGNPNNKMFSFDISWFDKGSGLYFLADRSNAAVDVVDTTGAFTGTADTLFGQMGGSAFKFQGDTGSSSTSGPNGVVASGNCVFATDGISTVESVNMKSSFVAPVSQVSTGGTKRGDELAYDPADGILLVINNADDPAFGTLINVNKNTCGMTVGTKIVFNTAGGLNATNGAEQPVWEPISQRFYVSIPEISGPGGGGPNGGVAQINPTTGAIEKVFGINFCQPAGLTVGPNGDLLVGCNTVFDTSGKACSAVVPAPSPTGTTAAHPATCTGQAAPQAAICNPARGCTDGALVSVPGAGGGDEVWFNSGDGNYYVTAGNNPVGPTIGVIASTTDTLTQLIPTLPPVPAQAGVHGAGTVHSVAASSNSNHVYVPLPANTDYPNCAQGCIGVFSAK